MKKIVALLICIISLCGETFAAETYISNVYGRQYESLNGKWDAIVDLYERGEEMKLYLNKRLKVRAISMNMLSMEVCA